MADEKTRRQVERLLPKEVVTETEFQDYKVETERQIANLNRWVEKLVRDVGKIEAWLGRFGYR